MSNELFNKAIELTRQGVSVIATDAAKKPARVNGKMLKWDPFKGRIANESELQAMFADNAKGIATIGGAVSGGLEILDFDYHEPYAGIEGRFCGNVFPEWAELVKAQRPDLFQRLVISKTPKSGNHVRYRYETETYEGKKSLACAYNQDAEGKQILKNGKPEIITIVEQRGEGSYALCPPSPGYEMMQGNILEIPLITKDERDFLVKTAKSFHLISNDLSQPTKTQTTNELRPGDDLNQRGNHRALLERYGWTFVIERKDGADLWRRPGKDDNGWSATWNAIPNRFYVFSTNASPLESEHTYDLFSLYTHLEHNGDFGAAAKALAAEGYGTQKKPSPEVLVESQSKKPKDNKIRDEKRASHLLFLAKRWQHQGNRRGEILAMLRAENEAKCEPVLKEAEIQAILDKVLPPLKTITAAELLAMEIPEPRWAVPNLIPEGLTILAGRPKAGKSFFGLGVALAVAHGGYALGHIPVEQGEALFVGLEDNLRRLQSRLRTMLAGEAPPVKLHLLTGLPRMNRGGLGILSDWLEQHPETRLVIIDTLNKVRPPKKRGADSYTEDYDALGEIQQFAMERGIAIMVIHHTRKSIGEYEIDEISGTTGVSAAADSILMIRKSVSGEVLYATGRDVDTQELALRFDKRDCQWEILGDAVEFAVSEQRRAIIAVLREAGEPMSPKEIAEALSKQSGTVRKLLSSMLRDGNVMRAKGNKYTIQDINIDEKNGNGGNGGNGSNDGNGGNDVGIVTSVTDAKNSGNAPKLSQDVVSDDSVTSVTSVTDVDKNSDNAFKMTIDSIDDNAIKSSQDVPSGEGNQDIQQATKTELIVTAGNACGNVTDAKTDGNAGNEKENPDDSEKVNHPLTDRLNEYLPRCPESFAKYIRIHLRENKLTLARAVEASNRMANKDTAGAWRVLRI
jgi:hypothetical protein